MENCKVSVIEQLFIILLSELSELENQDIQEESAVQLMNVL